MRKRDEITRSDTCLARAHSNEMVFVLLGRDPASPVAIRLWVAERLRLGKNVPGDNQTHCALECARVMEVEGRKWIGVSCSEKQSDREALQRIAQIIEAVDQRAMAADGPVSPTLKIMTQDEINRIYALAKLHPENWRP